MTRPSFRTRTQRITLISTIAIATMLLTAAAATSGRGLDDDSTAAKTVELIVRYGNGVEKHYKTLAWTQDMTVLDALRMAAEARPGVELDIRQTGGAETVFIQAIDGFINEGGGRDKRNWIFSVDGAFADRSAGVYKLRAGDGVAWEFRTPPRR